MKRVRFGLIVAVALVSCCSWTSHGWGQRCEAVEGARNCVKVVVGPPTVMPSLKGPAEQKILKALEEPVNFEFTETPLSDFLTFIKDNHDIQLFVDNRTLSDAGIDASTLPITTNVKGIKLRSALNLVLQAQGLAWSIGNEVFIITTQEAADQTFETRLYDVSDLTTNDEVAQSRPDFDSLIKTIVATVKGNWHESGGGATIREFSNSGIRAIAVAQTYDGHEQIESLLTELRKLRPQR